MKTLITAISLAILLSGCSTTPAEPPTAEQVEACQKMLAMGEGATHDHSAEKMGVPSRMALTHAQCRQLLARSKTR